MIGKLSLVFDIITALFGIGAFYFWYFIYKKTKGGSIAWPIMMLISVILVVAAIHPGITEHFIEIKEELVITMHMLWRAIISILLFMAGYIFYNKFKD